MSLLRSRFAAAFRGDLLLAGLLGAALLARVLTDDLAPPDSHQSGSLDFPGAIAVLFMLLAAVLLLRHRRGLRPTMLATLWVCVWTAIAIGTHGASAETLREGVREGSVIALGVIVCNAPYKITVKTAARIVVLVGLLPGAIAVCQLASHSGMDIAGNIRANGTFAHPDSAAMFFALAAAASLWLYLEDGRRRLDALLLTLFGAAVIATYSIDGTLALIAMLAGLGALHRGPSREKLGCYLAATLAVAAFLATPLGLRRILHESTTSAVSAQHGGDSTSLDWRLHKWETLLPRWEASPIVGQGLGSTVTAKAVPGDPYSGKPPHNEYVRYLVETGVLGLTILLSALALLIRDLARRRRDLGLQRRDPYVPLGHRELDIPQGHRNLGVPRGRRDLDVPQELPGDALALALVVIAGCLVNALADNTFLNSPTCYAAALIVVSASCLAAPYRRAVPARRRRVIANR